MIPLRPQARSHRGGDHGSGNSRNGFTPKRLGTEVADIDLATHGMRSGCQQQDRSAGGENPRDVPWQATTAIETH